MSASSSNLDLLLNLIVENCDQADYQGRQVPFMIECASLIEHRMPPTAVASLGVARAHLTAPKSREILEDALNKCWDSLGHRDTVLDDPDVSGTRAVISILCCQIQSEPVDFVDSTGFFLELVNNVEAHTDEQKTLLEKYFGRCL